MTSMFDNGLEVGPRLVQRYGVEGIVDLFGNLVLDERNSGDHKALMQSHSPQTVMLVSKSSFSPLR